MKLVHYIFFILLVSCQAENNTLECDDSISNKDVLKESNKLLVKVNFELLKVYDYRYTRLEYLQMVDSLDFQGELSLKKLMKHEEDIDYYYDLVLDVGKGLNRLEKCSDKACEKTTLKYLQGKLLISDKNNNGNTDIELIIEMKINELNLKYFETLTEAIK